MNKIGTRFMSFENLNALIEQHRKETQPYENYEFDSTNYTLLLIDINNLIKENQELRKRPLEERTKMYQNAYNYSQKMETKAIILETHQKEFIKWLEDEIERLPDLTTWFYRNAKGKLIGHTEIVKGAYKEILQKYKEIVNGTKQN